MLKYIISVALIALAIAVGLRVYGPYHDSADFRQKLDDITLGALEKDDATLSAEIMNLANTLLLKIPEGGVRIDRATDGHSVDIYVAYQGMIDMGIYMRPIDFSAHVRRELSFPAMMIKRSKEKVERSIKEYEGSLKEKVKQVGQ